MAIYDPTKPVNSSDRDAFGNWLSGFADGESCFLLKTFEIKDPKYGIYKCVRAEFIIDLRDDDRPILEEIQAFLGGCGTIVGRKGRPKHGNRPGARFCVARTSDNHNFVIPQFDRYPLRAKKRRDFVIWRQGVELHHALQQKPLGRIGRRTGFEPRWSGDTLKQFQALADALKDQRAYQSPIVMPKPIQPTNSHFKQHSFLDFVDGEDHA